MALERHVIELSARDNLSRAFQNVGREAEAAGRKGEEGARRASRASADWGRAASALGSSLGALTFAAIKLGNDSQVSLQRLQSSIESNGESWDDLADQIEAATDQALAFGFDDEDALDALNKLTQATGDTEEALKGLSIAQDLARARGISLAQAADLVAKAEQGRFSALARVGIIIDETSSKEEALAQLQAKYAGQAEAYAETNAAAWDRFGNTVENKLEGLGQALADFQGPLIALGSAGMAIGPLGDAFTALNGKAKLAAAGSKALSLALGPVGLVAAATLAGVALYEMRGRWDDAILSAAEATDKVKDFTNAIGGLANAGVSIEITQTAAELVEPYQQLGESIVQARQDVADLDAQLAELQSAEYIIEHPGISISDLDAQIKSLEALRDARSQLILSETEYQTVQAQTIQLLQHQGLNSEVVRDRVVQLYQEWQTGKIEAADLAWNLNWLTENANTYGLTLEQIAKQQEVGNKVWAEAQAQLKALNDEMIRAGGGASVANDSLVTYANTLDDLPFSYTTTRDLAIAADAANRDLAETFGATAAGARDLIAGTADGTAAIQAMQAETRALDTALADLSRSLAYDFAGAADRALNMVVGFTDGMVDSIQAAKDWSDAFSGDLGTDFLDDGSMSKLLDLLNQGKIDAEDYNEVLESQTRIYRDLNRATDAAAVIQAKQSDVVADGAEATADYLESLAELDEANQTIALGWADQGLADQVTQIADMAAGWGDLSTAQQDAFEEMVTSAAAMDPVLAAMLEDLGLIKASATDPSGWEISMDSSDAESDLDRVTEAMNDLITILADIYDLDIEVNDGSSGAREDIETFAATTHSATVEVGANTSPFDEAVAGRRGDQGDAYIDVFANYRGGPHALGGMIGTDAFPHAQLGRMGAGQMTLVGEAGPELVHLPFGSNVTPNHASRYQMGGGGGMTFTGPITVIANNPQQFMQQMRQYMTHTEARR
jgi:hypothetical protein